MVRCGHNYGPQYGPPKIEKEERKDKKQRLQKKKKQKKTRNNFIKLLCLKGFSHITPAAGLYHDPHSARQLFSDLKHLCNGYFSDFKHLCYGHFFQILSIYAMAVPPWRHGTNIHTSYLSFFLHMAHFWLQFFSTQKTRKSRQNRFHGKTA